MSFCSFEDLGEPVNKKFMELQQEVHHVVSAAQRDRDEAQRCQERLAGEMSSLRERLRKYQERYQTQVRCCCSIQVIIITDLI